MSYHSKLKLEDSYEPGMMLPALFSDVTDPGAVTCGRIGGNCYVVDLVALTRVLKSRLSSVEVQSLITDVVSNILAVEGIRWIYGFNGSSFIHVSRVEEASSFVYFVVRRFSA